MGPTVTVGFVSEYPGNQAWSTRVGGSHIGLLFASAAFAAPQVEYGSLGDHAR